MSSSGQGDQIGEISKDDDSEISSTTSDDGGMKPSVSGPSNTASETIPTDADSTAESSEPTCEDAIPVIPTSEYVDDLPPYNNQDNDDASTTAKLIDDKDNKTEIMEAEIGSSDDEVNNDEVNISHQESDGVKKIYLDAETKASFSKEIAEMISADVDKDSSSLGEDIELRWEDDDEVENENDETTPTVNALKLLDFKTTPDDSGMKPSISGPSTASETIPTETDSTAKSSEPTCEVAIPAIPTSEYVDDLPPFDNQDNDDASTTTKLIDDKDNKTEIMEIEMGSGDEEVNNDEANISPQESDGVKKKYLEAEKKASFSKEIAEMILADVDKDSGSLHEDIELRWEDDDEDENENVDTTPTVDVLKLLDRELGIDASNKLQEDNAETVKFIEAVVKKSELENVDEINIESSIMLKSNEDTDNTIKVDKSSVTKNDKQDLEPVVPSGKDESSHNIDEQYNIENSKIHTSEDVEISGSSSFEKCHNIIREIGNLPKNAEEDIEMEKAIEVPSAGNPQIIDQDASLTDEYRNQDIDMENDVISKKYNPNDSTTSMKDAEIISEPKEVEEMDVDTFSEIIKDSSISEENTLVPIEIIYPNINEKENEEKSYAKESRILENEDELQRDIDIATMKISETSVKVGNIEEEVSKTNDTDIQKIQSTPSDIPSSLPIEVSNIVDLDDKDCQTNKDNIEALISEQLAKKDTQIIDNKKELNEKNIDKSQNIEEVDENAAHQEGESDDKSKLDLQKIDDCENIQDVDINVSQQERDSILDTTITPNVHHRINKPNVMLDIPTQELSDIEAELDDDDDFDEENNSEEKAQSTKIDSSLVKKTTEVDGDGPLDDIDIKQSKDPKIVTETVSTASITSVTEDVERIIETGATSLKFNVITVSPTKPNLIPSSISMQNQSSASNSLQFDDKSTPKIVKSTDDTSQKEEVFEKLSTEKDVNDKKQLSKSEQIIVNEKSSASEKNYDTENLSTSKPEKDIDYEKPSTSKLEKDMDYEKPSTSKPENGDEKPSSPKEMQVDDVLPSTSKIHQETDEQKPCTSKDVPLLEKLTPDDTDEAQEVTDSLGLLAESFRVMDDENDDDDDAEDPEVDDNEEDEDFDPYEEMNSEMAEDMEDSNTPPPELDLKDLDKPEPSSKLHEERESDEFTMDIADGTLDIVDDIECVENELQGLDLPDDAISETPSTEENAGKNEPEIIDADTHQETSISSCQPDKIINILEKVLGRKSFTAPAKQPLSGTVRSYVELEGSSDSDDVLEVSKSDDLEASDVISVNIPKGVEVMSTSGDRCTSEIVSKEGEVIISGVPKPPPQKMSKINTSEVSIKTTGSSSPAIHIPETSVNKKALKEEIFNLDSDEEDTKKDTSAKIKLKASNRESPKLSDRKCVNPECTNDTRTYYQADRATAAYYSLTRRSALVCEQCRQRASERSEALINGIKDLRPLLELDMDAPSQQLVEISDSDSDEEIGDDTDYIGEKSAQFLENNLADMINETWTKYKLDSRLKETETFLMDELEKMEVSAKEIDSMLDECQKKTDAIRLDFYKDYELRRKSVGAIIIHDTPFSSYSHTEKDIDEIPAEVSVSRYPKRRAASVAYDTPAKKPAIPLGYSPLEGSHTSEDQGKAEDDKEDISVVKLSAESAPADLPPCGEIVRPPLKTGMIIYAMRNAFGTWLKGRIVDVQPKAAGQQFTQCRVKFEHKVKNPCKVLAARCLAYPEPSEVRMTIGTRVVALFKDPQNVTRRESFYSGVIAEIPNPVNSYRYLVFFDDGYAQYVHHQDTRIVCESSNLVWEEVHPFIRDFICNYLLSYPERPMVRLHAGEKLKTEWNGKWWDSKVLRVDASIALINFDEDNRTEWIYRGSTRLAPLYLELQAAEKAGEGRTRSRLPRSKAQMRSNMPCVEYTRSDEQAAAKVTAETQALQQHNEEMRRQRSVAKKSTATAAQAPTTIPLGTPFEGVISRVVYYTPKNAVKPYKMTTHTCTAKCRRSDLLSLKDLRTYNPLAKPLLSGWERQTVRYKGHRSVVYRAPCGRRLRNMFELHKYLRILQSDLSVDLFDFTPGTHCLAEFVLHKCIVSKKDLSHGKENVPVPCVNYYDDSLPEFCSYNTERTPTAGVPLNLDPEFLCGCDCTDDCMDKTKCACWKMTLEGARTIGLEGPNIGYVYRRLPEPLPSGIYECNSRCKCKQTCLNRVAQHPLQLKLQVFKTINRGWGIRALNDVPKGSFLCIYAGNLLTDATANLDGLNEGDEYLAELDYIEVVEGMKEGFEDDIPDADKKLDKKAESSHSESEPTSESEDERDLTKKDGDFQPGYIPQPDGNMQFKKSLRKRQKAKKKEEQEKNKEQTKKRDDCITISDDEEVREPSRFTAQAGMVDKDLLSKHSSRVSVRTLFGKDEACYIMDAKVQGNIGRYLNHSCHPNVFVQNVFVDTHDPRFPWVAFFALSNVRAGTELTWNYNYDIGSVPEKVLYCYCGAPNCRGRLL